MADELVAGDQLVRADAQGWVADAVGDGDAAAEDVVADGVGRDRRRSEAVQPRASADGPAVAVDVDGLGVGRDLAARIDVVVGEGDVVGPDLHQL